MEKDVVCLRKTLPRSLGVQHGLINPSRLDYSSVETIQRKDDGKERETEGKENQMNCFHAFPLLLLPVRSRWKTRSTFAFISFYENHVGLFTGAQNLRDLSRARRINATSPCSRHEIIPLRNPRTYSRGNPVYQWIERGSAPSLPGLRAARLSRQFG